MLLRLAGRFHPVLLGLCMCLVLPRETHPRLINQELGSGGIESQGLSLLVLGFRRHLIQQPSGRRNTLHRTTTQATGYPTPR